MRPLTKLAEALTASQLWIALGAASQVLVTALYHDRGLDDAYLGKATVYALAVLCGSVSFYAFHRVSTLWRLLPMLPTKRWRVLHGYQRWLFAMIPLGAALAVGFAVQLPMRWWLAVLPAVAFSSLYALPVFRGSRGRDFGAVKLAWLSVGWVWVCNVVPALMSANLQGHHIVERLLFILGFALVFDYRDRALDVRSGVRTWAPRLGKWGGLAVSASLLLASLGVSYWYFSGDWGQLFAGLASGMTTALTLPLIAYAYLRAEPGYLYHDLVLDALLLLPAVLLLSLVIFLNSST